MPLFNQHYQSLNKSQKEAVDSIEGPVIVIAGPGTGKTTILTLRIANILEKTDTAPENILALTFTESGAYAIRKKLVDLIGASAYKINIHTFHGFAERIIQQYPDYFPRIIGSKVITDAEQIKIIEKLVQSKDIELLRPYGDPNYYVRPILSEINNLKRENISPKKFLQSIKKDIALQKTDTKGNKEISATELDKNNKRNNKNLELAQIYEHYESALTKYKYYDFNDMLLELIGVMEHDDSFKLILQESFQYILADEHQDANAAQNRILELLSDFHQSPNLFIVGDDKQAIYRFQGASLDNFLYFKDKYKDAKIIELTHNYRSQQGILDASHSLISKNPTIPGMDRAKLISLQIGSKPISVYEFANKEKELEYLVYLIKDLTNKSYKLENLAILYRTNNEAEEIAKTLKKANIRYRIESDHNVLDEIDPAKVVIISRAVNDISSDENLAKTLLLKEFSCDPGSVSLLFSYSKKEKIPLFRVINDLKKGKISLALAKDDKENIFATFDKLNDWAREAQYQSYPNLLQKIIEDIELIPLILKESDSLPRLSALEEFFGQVTKISQSKKTFLLSDFVDYVDVVLDHGLVTKRGFTDHINGVRLMTAHRSKGLEFDHVFIVNCFDGNWGNRNKRNLFQIPIIDQARDVGNIEDERRLFYVALTRARESVHISFSRVVGDKEAVVSQFLTEIDDDYMIFTEPSLVPSGLYPETIETIENNKKSDLSILDPDFVRSKFIGQPLSVTHLNNYLECPWQYFFVNLIRIPQVETKHQVYGTAIHNALRTFFEAYKEERDLSKKKFLEIFEHNVIASPMSLQDKNDSIKKGKNALSGYYDEYNGSWNRNLFTEYSIKIPNFNIDSKNSIILTGNLDKVELIDSHNVSVIDYKTAKPKSRNEIEGKTKEADGNYKRQLIFYQLLLNLEGKYAMNSGTIDFIEPNDRGIYKKEQFMIEKDEVEALKEIIKNVAKEIISLSFADKYCDNKECKYCQLAKVIGV